MSKEENQDHCTSKREEQERGISRNKSSSKIKGEKIKKRDH